MNAALGVLFVFFDVLVMPLSARFHEKKQS
jgi:hypothetical protein